jgi:hypothetical protein
MSPIRSAPPALAAADEALRAAYLDEVLGVLYPAPCLTQRNSAVDTPVAEYLVVPNVRRPRLLVPAHDRRLAAAAVRRYAQPQSRLARLGRNAVVAALRTGASSVLLRDRVRVTGPTGASAATPDTIERYLARALGPGLSLSVHIGPARANRKPVLQLLSPDGRTVGFAKLGTGPLTRQLVRDETAALIALGHAELTQVTVPKVLHSGQWRGHEVLVQSALPSWRPAATLSGARLVAAMREVAACCGTRRGTLAESGYWARLHTRLRAVADHREGRQLADAADRLVVARGAVRLEYGAWHGDWAPWNMASLGHTLLVWDWERFTPGVPLGFDALHHELQRLLGACSGAADGGAQEAVDATLAAAPDLLRPFGVTTGEAAQVTALLYLLDLATRYVADRQAEAGARLGVLGTWLLPVLLSTVESL